MSWKKLSVIAVLTSVMLGCASDDDNIQVAEVPTITNQFSPVTLWRAQVGQGVGKFYSQLAPVYDYDKIYAADRQGLVMALNAETGEAVWRTALNQNQSQLISGGLTLGYEKVFFGTERGELFALNAEDGSLAWKVDAGGEVLAKPLVDEGLVIVNTSRGELSAYDQETGEVKWRVASDIPTLTLRGESAPVAVAGGVFWGMANGRLGAAFIANGNIIWQQVIATPKGATEIDRLVDVDATPVISGSTLYAVGYNGQLVAIDLRSGNPMWRRNYSSAMDFTIDGNTLYLVTTNDRLVAVDARSGTELWQNNELENRQLTPPVVIDDYLMVADAEGIMYWINLYSGDFISQQQIDKSGIAVAPIAVGDAYVVMGRDGAIFKQQIPY